MKDFLQKKIRNNEIKNQPYDIQKWETKIKRKHLKYRANKNTYDFQQYNKIRSFGDNIYTRKISIDNTETDQIQSIGS